MGARVSAVLAYELVRIAVLVRCALPAALSVPAGERGPRTTVNVRVQEL